MTIKRNEIQKMMNCNNFKTVSNKFTDGVSYIGAIFGFGIIGALLLGIGPMIPSFGITAMIVGALSLICAGIAQIMCIVTIFEGMGEILDSTKNTNLILSQQMDLIRKSNDLAEYVENVAIADRNALKDYANDICKATKNTNQLLMNSQQYICDHLAELLDHTRGNGN